MPRYQITISFVGLKGYSRQHTTPESALTLEQVVKTWIESLKVQDETIATIKVEPQKHKAIILSNFEMKTADDLPFEDYCRKVEIIQL